MDIKQFHRWEMLMNPHFGRVKLTRLTALDQVEHMSWMEEIGSLGLPRDPIIVTQVITRFQRSFREITE
jgi:hypothetical protein